MYISKEQYQKLLEELQRLETVERREIAERLKKAKELGDLSENAEYTEALEAKERLESRILTLKKLLSEAKIIKNRNNGNKILPGTKFEVIEKTTNQRYVFTLVGLGETDFSQGKISTESPLGQAFLNKKVGEEVEVQTPRGKFIYLIEKIYLN